MFKDKVEYWVPFPSSEHPHWSELWDISMSFFFFCKIGHFFFQCPFCLPYLQITLSKGCQLESGSHNLLIRRTISLLSLVPVYFCPNTLSKFSTRRYNSGKVSISHFNFYFWIRSLISDTIPLTKWDERVAITLIPSLASKY